LVYGKKIINTGLSSSAAKYAGYSVKKNQVSAMTISGLIAGLAGIMMYCGFQAVMPITVTARAIPNDGFTGISVGLISMCSPIAVIPVSLFFGMIQSSKAVIALDAGIDTTIVDLIFGIMVYGAAIISALF